MRFGNIILSVTLLLGIAISQQVFIQTDTSLLNYVKTGMTFSASTFPSQNNSWVGYMGCNGCNPEQGDTPCTTLLPILCIINHKVTQRPYYNFSELAIPYYNPDKSYYNGWTGGSLTVTPPIRGYEVQTKAAGNTLCQQYFGKNAKIAEFTDGYYMKNMNTMPQKTWKFWDWNQAICGGYGFWGFFNHKYPGKTWVWNNINSKANCAFA